MLTINKIAELIDAEVIGDGDVQVKRIAHPRCLEKGDMTFAFDEETARLIEETDAVCLLTTIDVGKYKKPVLKVKDMKAAATMIYNLLLKIVEPKKGNIHPTAVIEEDVILGKNVGVGANAFIGKGTEVGDNTNIEAGCVLKYKVKIGKGCYINANVTLYEYTEIHDNVIIHSGTSIGADGFGYITKDGEIYKVPQMGRVVIKNNVEIGANTCIDRGTFDTTVIGKNTKIDNFVQIAHNVNIGENVFIAAQTGIAGSASVGNNVMMGGQSGISNHISVAANKKLAAKTGVIRNIKESDPETFFGYPSRDAREAMKQLGFLSWLNKHSKKIMKMVKNLPEE